MTYHIEWGLHHSAELKLDEMKVLKEADTLEFLLEAWLEWEMGNRTMASEIERIREYMTSMGASNRAWELADRIFGSMQ